MDLKQHRKTEGENNAAGTSGAPWNINGQQQTFTDEKRAGQRELPSRDSPLFCQSARAMARRTLFFLGPGIFQSNGAVENLALGGGVLIAGKITDTLELDDFADLQRIQRFFHNCVDALDGIRVELSEKIDTVGSGLFNGEQAVIETDFGFDAIFSVDPVNSAFDLAAVGGVAAAGFGIEGTFVKPIEPNCLPLYSPPKDSQLSSNK